MGKLDGKVAAITGSGRGIGRGIALLMTKEGAKAIVNDIVINGVTGDAGTQRTKRDAIVRAIPLMRGDPLRADKITEAERALYVTDAFRQVLISQQPAGETATVNVLGPGDSVCFDSTTPHRYRNDRAEPAVGVWFVIENLP